MQNGDLIRTASRGTPWNPSGRKWMSTSRVALAARNRGTRSRKAISSSLLGGAAVACLVLGAGYAVYSNIIAASVFPTLGEAGFDEPVIKARPALEARQDAAQAVRDVFATLTRQAPNIGKPATADAAASPSLPFSERFAAAQPQGVESRAAEGAPPETPKIAEAAKPKPAATQIALNVPKPAPQPRPEPKQAEAKPADAKPAKLGPGDSLREMAERAKAAVMSIASNERHSIVDRLWGKPSDSHGSLLSYASADASSITASISQDQDPARGGSPPYDRSTAVYDISAKMVYLPDGTKLEAHSGLGSELDDPDSAKIRMRGVTPPHIYELKPRESLFHGVPALRLNPIGGEGAIYGRSGLLAHSYMLGPNGDSNGCVSFKDYYAFLDAYKNKGIRKLAVLAKID
jgi:type VI secretion system (T6SS) effector TldE1-like protein